jgi:hypothetical protein
MNKSEYQKYLASREWALLKKQVRERCRGKCERCKTGDYESTHHLTYTRIGRELLDDLQAVCNRCHDFLSGKSDFDPTMDRLSVLAGRCFSLACKLQDSLCDLYEHLEPLQRGERESRLYRYLLNLNEPLSAFSDYLYCEYEDEKLKD